MKEETQAANVNQLKGGRFFLLKFLFLFFPCLSSIFFLLLVL